MALCISSFASCHWSVVFDAFTVAFSFQPFFLSILLNLSLSPLSALVLDNPPCHLFHQLFDTSYWYRPLLG
jgi:hypothetical protein